MLSVRRSKLLLLKKKTGQAAVEYVLLVAVMSVIFGAVFSNMRKSLFRLWVCEMGPRIESVTACGGQSSNNKCWDDLISQTATISNNDNIKQLMKACQDASR